MVVLVLVSLFHREGLLVGPFGKEWRPFLFAMHLFLVRIVAMGLVALVPGHG